MWDYILINIVDLYLNVGYVAHNGLLVNFFEIF